MKWLDDYRMKLVLIGFVAAIVLCGGTSKADFTFGTPTNLGPPVNTSVGEEAPTISADGLELYFASGPNRGGSGGYDLWVATRTSTEDAWGPPANLGPTINSGTHDLWTSISADGLSLYFDSKRGPFSKYNIWVTTRASKNDPWQEPVNLGPTVNVSQYYDNSPCISADGLSLYFCSLRPGGIGGSGDIWVTKRATKDDVWGEPVNLGPVVNSNCGEMGPAISADGLMLFFFSGLHVTIAGPARPGGFGRGDIWMSRRANKDAPWEEPVNLGPSVNTVSHEILLSISTDGSTLYFTSDRSGGYGSTDIWQVPIMPVVDLNGDGIVDAADMCVMVDHWGTDNGLCDIGPMPWGDGVVDVQDLIVLSEHLFEDYRLIAHWKLDEEAGNTAHDSVGEYDGTLHGEPVWQPEDGIVNGTLQFDGIGDYVSTPFILDPYGGSLSAFAWVYGGSPGQAILSQANSTLGSDSTWLCIDASDGKLITRLMHPPFPPLKSETVITDSRWHHVGLVYDLDALKRRLYVDGAEVAKDMGPVPAIGSDGGLYIGAGENLEANTFFFGLIDDVRIYDEGLSAEEVADLAR